MSEKKSILILCTGNSARSQMAEGLLRHMCAGKYEIHSAGTEPSQVRPEAIEAMNEINLDISGHRSKSIEEFTGKEIDYVLTVCDNARTNCPHFPAKTKLFHQSFEDPAEVSGDEETRLKAFKKTRDEINMYLAEDFLSKLSKLGER
jgi:arsenate reductase (thioredoxin)